MNCPKPGVYENVPFEEYITWDAISNSRLGLMKLSPLHYREQAWKEPTAAMALGTLMHCGVLEPLQFAARYAIAPDFHLEPGNTTASGQASTSKATRYVRTKMEEFARANVGREVVARDWYDQAVLVVRRLCDNETARELVNGRGPVEASLVWEDQQTGLRCKARIDKVSRQRIVDIKTTRQLSLFDRAVGNYGYHRQLAHYMDGWATLMGEVLEPWIIAIENTPPCCCRAAPLHPDSLTDGIAERSKLMHQLAECLATDTWPAPENPETWRSLDVTAKGDLASWFAETLEQESGA